MAGPTLHIPAVFRPIDRLMAPVRSFLKIEAAGGILLLASTAIAVAWANSPWAQSYYDFWHVHLKLDVGAFTIDETLGHLVNDGLMVIFFFVVGLEIKREMLVGELTSLRKAAVPIAAAIGGMAGPALIFTAFNFGTEAAGGWAIPCATDIAFALGIMAMVGKRVPLQLKIFLMALAIVDDIGAVLVIAVFYTSELSVPALGVAGVALALMIALNILHVRRPAAYIVLGLILWLAFYKSGVHATLAGVLAAFTIPSKFRIDGADFVRFARKAIDEYDAAGGNENDVMSNPERQRWVAGLEAACEHVQTPLLKMEHYLHPWSAFLIVPIFALANAGVTFGDGLIADATSRLSLGIIFGLLVGKQIGIMLAAWSAVKLGLGEMPAGVTWTQIYATTWLAGIGFTMSLFIAYLGFGEGELLNSSKVGVLVASLVAGSVGFVLLRVFTKK